MDLSGYTEGQKKAITHLEGPLLICAGAGTGKTFTLTQRIAYALTGDPENGVDPLLDSIDQALVITFTNKAAAELKSRFRSMLRSVGRFDDALKVDSAWVSTIHGMCSRILREHALELGIDPEFKLVMGAEQEDALTCAIDLAIRNTGDYRRYHPLFAEYDTHGVKKMLKTLMDAASCQTEGLAALTAGPGPEPTARTIYDVLEAARSLAITGTKKTAEYADAAAQKIEEFIESGEGEEKIPELVGSLNTAGMRGEAAKEFKEAAALLHDQALANKGRRMLDLLFELAESVDAHYRAILEERSSIDTSNLIKTTLRAFDEHPEIAQQYTERFQLIMVDEFQDTSQLQIDMIERIAGADHARLCTVGDSQQSIYRFQGADVSVYLKHKKDMAQSGALLVELQDNFRSHADILAFVRRICGAPGFFVEEFLDLNAGRKWNAYKGSAPRIELALTLHENGASALAVEQEARHIAERFRTLIDEGHQPSDMAILMGSTTNMPAYARALRDQGIPSIASGGSKYYEADHVKRCMSLVRVLANPYDSVSLMDVLSSEILPVSSNDLLLLSTRFNENAGIPMRQNLVQGLLYDENASEGYSDLLQHAKTVLRRAWGKLGKVRPHRLFMETLVDSGWIDRLQAQGQEGQAVLADILKLKRIILSKEEGACNDMATIAIELDASAESETEASGVLSVEGLQAVRLMTVHGSKGLQFPIVAVTSCYTSRKEGGRLLAYADSGKVFASLIPKDAKLKYSPELAQDDIDLNFATDPVDLRCKITEKESRSAEEERRRLFYVAATRAAEYLIVAMTKRASKTPVCKEVEADLLHGLFPGESFFPIESATFDYQGSEPGVYTYAFVQKPERNGAEEPASPVEEAAMEGAASPGTPTGNTNTPGIQGKNVNGTALMLPILENGKQPILHQVQRRSDFFSYSSLPNREDGKAFNSTENHTGTESTNPSEKPAQTEGLTEGKKSAAIKEYENTGSRTEAVPINRKKEIDPLDESISVKPSSDNDKATDFGTALHKTCEWLALQSEINQSTALAAARRFATQYSVTETERLESAVLNWLHSSLCAKSYSFRNIQPEVPFCVKMKKVEESDSCSKQGNENACFLEGEIDLLCSDGGDHAFIVDYKTGGKASETAEQIHRKHSLQAQCYAYATLKSGYRSVELHFARVEQKHENGEMQTTSYAYTKDDMKALEKTIQIALAKSKR